MERWRICSYSALQKTREFVQFPYKLAIFEWGFWAIIALLFPWTPGSKQCEIGGFQKGNMYLFMCFKGLQSCRLSIFFRLSKITFSFIYIILSYENSATYEHFYFSSTKTLTACNFAAPWSTTTCFTFWKTSILYLFGARLPRGL